MSLTLPVWGSSYLKPDDVYHMFILLIQPDKCNWRRFDACLHVSADPWTIIHGRMYWSVDGSVTSHVVTFQGAIRISWDIL